MKAKTDIYFAFAGSNTHHDFENEEEGVEIVNLQLDLWRRAIEEFKKVNKAKLDYASIYLIILLAGQSLNTFLGINYKKSSKSTDPNHVPTLKRLIESLNELFPILGKDFKLSESNFGLYKALIEDVIYKFNDLGKHIGNNKIKQLQSIKYSDIKKYMETIQDFWKWILEEITPDNADSVIEAFFSHPL